jgi:hypothetical protein
MQVLRDCHQLTSQAMIFVSTAVPSLRCLDLRECANIDLTHGLKQLEALTCIEELYVFCYPIYCSSLLASFLPFLVFL